jgi:hypothetical protein
MVVTEEEKSSSSPASLVQGKKKTYGAIQNGTVFYSSFLFWKCMKRRHFSQNVPVSFKRKLAPKRVRFKIKPSICALLHFGPWFLDFFN